MEVGYILMEEEIKCVNFASDEVQFVVMVTLRCSGSGSDSYIEMIMKIQN